MKSLTIITLGSLRDNSLAYTISRSSGFAACLAERWIFVLFTKIEVSHFYQYLESHSLTAPPLDIYVLSCDAGISQSMNLALSNVDSIWSLFVHAGDYLADPSQVPISLIANLLESNTSPCDAHIFGTNYVRNGAVVGRTSHLKSGPMRIYEPWVPHESSIVKTSTYTSLMFSTHYKSAMDYELFLRMQLNRYVFVRHPYYITYFVLDGLSTRISLSVREIFLALSSNLSGRKSFKSILSAFLASVFIFVKKHIFLWFRR